MVETGVVLFPTQRSKFLTVLVDQTCFSEDKNDEMRLKPQKRNKEEPFYWTSTAKKKNSKNMARNGKKCVVFLIY